MTASASEVDRYVLADDGTFPNSGLPLLHCRRAVPDGILSRAQEIERRFAASGWGGIWRNGVYDFHHYHSTTPEALGVFADRARVLFGGERGVTVEVGAGDLIVIPAGVAHKGIDASADFGVIAAYPPGHSPDMCYGRPGERPRADRRITQVEVPRTDPFDVSEGSVLRRFWKM